MRYLIVLFCALTLALTPGLAMAKKGGNSSGSHGKGPDPSDSAYEHASEKAKFKRDDDWQGGKKGYDDDEYEYAEDGKKIKSKKKLKQEDDGEKSRIREETRTEERVKERVRAEDDDSDGEKERSEVMEQMRERILHRNQNKE